MKKILHRLDKYEEFIITAKYNLDNKDKFRNYRVGSIPDEVIYQDEGFHYCKTKYYEIRQEAFDKINDLLEIANIE